MSRLYPADRFQLLREMKRREWMDGTQPYDCLPAVRMTSPHKFLILNLLVLELWRASSCAPSDSGLLFSRVNRERQCGGPFVI